MTSYTLWQQAAETVTAAGATGGGTLGVEINVSQACRLNALWLYSPSGHGLTGVPPTIGLYTVTGTSLVTTQAATWSGAAGSGWIRAAFTAPPLLAAGTNYMAVVYDGSATAVWFIYNSSSWASSITNGPLTASNANGQGWYTATASPVQYPSSQLADWNWFLDVEVFPAVAPFPQPGRAVRGGRARKGTSAGSAGAPRAAAPVPPAFPQPGEGTRGRASARKGTAAGSPGAKYAYVPVIPAPFAQPHKAAAGRPSARKGTARTVNPGAPYVYVPAAPAPFAQPHRAVAGRPAARRGSASGTRPSAWSPLVQETSGSTTGTTLTLTFPRPTTGGAIIVALCGYYGGSVSGFTVGGTAITFLQAAVAGTYNAEVWACYADISGATTVAVTASEPGIIGWACEVSGVVTLDTSAGTHGTSGAFWSSGATPATIPAQHFVIGVGSIVGNTGSITGPGAPWAALPAYTDVASNGSHVGGVCGYQQPSGSGAYTYPGTSGTGGDWAAVTAAFLAVPRPAQVIDNWGGYLFSEHAAAGYTGISATFTIPACSGGDYNSIWVGLGSVYQVGLYQTYEASGFSGNSSTRPWTFWIQGAGEDWSQASYPTAYGDVITLTMQLTPANWLMTIQNATEGWTYTETRSVLSVNIGSIQGNGAGPAFWPFPLPQAEVIVEKEAAELADYGSLAFTSITTTPAATVAPVPLYTANANVDQYPGPFTLAAGTGSFTMYWQAYS